MGLKPYLHFNGDARRFAMLADKFGIPCTINCEKVQ
jgi:uncharacterized glyoxalase superfamily protein PhnB